MVVPTASMCSNKEVWPEMGPLDKMRKVADICNWLRSFPENAFTSDNFSSYSSATEQKLQQHNKVGCSFTKRHKLSSTSEPEDDNDAADEKMSLFFNDRYKCRQPTLTIKKSQFYVCCLGARETRSLNNQRLLQTVLKQLLCESVNRPPLKLTLEISEKGLKIVQARPTVSKSGKLKTELLKCFVPSHCIAASCVGASHPFSDTVVCTLLLLNNGGETRWPISVHAYRCDSTQTAQIINARLNVIISKLSNQRRLADLENLLLTRGFLEPSFVQTASVDSEENNALQKKPVEQKYPTTLSSGRGSLSSETRNSNPRIYAQPSPMTDLHRTLFEELKMKLQNRNQLSSVAVDDSSFVEKIAAHRKGSTAMASHIFDLRNKPKCQRLPDRNSSSSGISSENEQLPLSKASKLRKLKPNPSTQHYFDHCQRIPKNKLSRPRSLAEPLIRYNSNNDDLLSQNYPLHRDDLEIKNSSTNCLLQNSSVDPLCAQNSETAASQHGNGCRLRHFGDTIKFSAHPCQWLSNSHLSTSQFFSSGNVAKQSKNNFFNKRKGAVHLPPLTDPFGNKYQQNVNVRNFWERPNVPRTSLNSFYAASANNLHVIP